MFNHEGGNPWIRPSNYRNVHEKTKAGNGISEDWGTVQEGTLLIAVGAQALQGRVWCTLEGGYLTGSMDRVP